MGEPFGVDWAAIDRAVGRGVTTDPPHPGDVLNEWMVAFDVTQADLARRLGVTGPYVSMIRSHVKGVGPEMALHLERATKIRAEVWLHLQGAWSLARLRDNARRAQVATQRDAPYAGEE